MRVLIDTQILIWFFEGNKSLPANIQSLIMNASNEVCVSQISLFEIAIKLKVGGRLTLKRGLDGLIQDCRNEAISILSITDNHLLAYNSIPFFNDHRDPRSDVSVRPAYSGNGPRRTNAANLCRRKVRALPKRS